MGGVCLCVGEPPNLDLSFGAYGGSLAEFRFAVSY